MMPTASRIATLMGSVSFLSLITALAAHAQTAPPAQVAQATPEAVPEQVLVTGSLIYGEASVGVSVTNFSVQDFTVTGNLMTGDLFRTLPSANVSAGLGSSAQNSQQERVTRVNLRGLDVQGQRSLMVIDGIRYPGQADGLCVIDPSIIPSLALDRIDVLVDGASAIYGSFAMVGVINLILKRGFDGATTLASIQGPTDGGGGLQYQASQLYGRTWDGGDVTITYEWIDIGHITSTVHSNYTANYTPWGLDNRDPIGASVPGTISINSPNVKNGAGVSGVGTVCPNCYAVPKGAGSNFNAALNNGVGPLVPADVMNPVNWTTLAAGTTNEIDPLKQGWEGQPEQKNSAVITFDQRLFPGVSFFASGFYSNRRTEDRYTPEYSGGATGEIRTFVVPTTNPYYPGGAPPNLQVSYDLAVEDPVLEASHELSERYSFGLNLDLPFGWIGQIYDSLSYETNQYLLHEVNDNSVSIALGNTVGGVTKPQSIPYLNLFCDPAAFRCNSPTTLAYIRGLRELGDRYAIGEKGAHFDGPLFDLPGGQVKAAIGGETESDNVVPFTAINFSSPQVQGSVTPPPFTQINDSEPYAVWAAFAQLDLPVFGDNFNIPLARRLDIEASWRHDAYSGTIRGQTSVPRLAFTWLIDEMIGATIRGSWGESFRFANAGEYSTVASDQDPSFNLPGQPVVTLPCVNGQPKPGSVSADLFAAGFACGSTPGGINWSGGPQPVLRSYITPAGTVATREGGTNLGPETGKNYSLGVEIAPQIDLLRGFDLLATWFSDKISGVLAGQSTASSATLADPTVRYGFILPSNLGCPVADNAMPTACAPFEKMVAAAILDPASLITLSQQSNIYWLADGGYTNTGYTHLDGVDFNASYVFDAGEYGTWNAGIVGTYYLHKWNTTQPGGTPIDSFHNCNEQPAGGVSQGCVAVLPQLIWRSRLGWSNGPYSVTGFMNFQSHYFTGTAVPPNVNLQCTSSGGTVGGGTLPCAISNWSNIEPDFITFDLSLGYNTGDLPANRYLKNLTIQLTIHNLLGKHSPFEYDPSTNNNEYVAYVQSIPNFGRVIGLTLLKSW